MAKKKKAEAKASPETTTSLPEGVAGLYTAGDTIVVQRYKVVTVGGVAHRLLRGQAYTVTSSGPALSKAAKTISVETANTLFSKEAK